MTAIVLLTIVFSLATGTSLADLWEKFLDTRGWLLAGVTVAAVQYSSGILTIYLMVLHLIEVLK